MTTGRSDLPTADRQQGSVAHAAQALVWLRQVIETVDSRLLTAFRLEHERPHTLDGWQAQLLAKIGLHNLCLWLNRRTSQPVLAIAATTPRPPEIHRPST